MTPVRPRLHPAASLRERPPFFGGAAASPKHRSPRTVNVAIAALRFLFEVTLQRPDVLASVRNVRVQHHQPDVPSGSQVTALLDRARTPKHRATFMLLYGTRLRISEMLSLRPADIDSQRMVLHVRDTRTRHDRILPLPPKALEALRAYWRADRPKGGLALRQPFGRARAEALAAQMRERLAGRTPDDATLGQVFVDALARSPTFTRSTRPRRSARSCAGRFPSPRCSARARETAVWRDAGPSLAASMRLEHPTLTR